MTAVKENRNIKQYSNLGLTYFYVIFDRTGSLSLVMVQSSILLWQARRSFPTVEPQQRTTTMDSAKYYTLTRSILSHR